MWHLGNDAETATYLHILWMWGGEMFLMMLCAETRAFWPWFTDYGLCLWFIWAVRSPCRWRMDAVIQPRDHTGRMDCDVRTAGYEAYFGAEGGSFRNFSKYLKFQIARMFCEAVLYLYKCIWVSLRCCLTIQHCWKNSLNRFYRLLGCLERFGALFVRLRYQLVDQLIQPNTSLVNFGRPV